MNTVMQQWSLTVEHQFASDWAARASYVGAQTHHALYYAGDINKPGVQQPNVPLQRQRPYQPWGQINETHSDGKGNFNQLQFELNKRFSAGFLVQAQYNWTVSRDNVPLVGGTKIRPTSTLTTATRTRSRVRHSPSITSMSCRSGADRKFDLSNRVLDSIAGGWSVSGITIYRTGAPFSVNFAVPSSVIGWWGGRADAVAGADVYSGQSGSHDIVNGVPWFNVNAFAPPRKWAYGNSQRNSVFGPGFWNWDIGIQKSFQYHRNPASVESDGLDAFNHFNLGNPSATIPTRVTAVSLTRVRARSSAARAAALFSSG